MVRRMLPQTSICQVSVLPNEYCATLLPPADRLLLFVLEPVPLPLCCRPPV